MDGENNIGHPVWDEYRLGALGEQQGFDKWDIIGIFRVGDLRKDGDIVTWPSLQSDYELAPGEVYKYIQIRHAIRTTLPRGDELPEASPLERRLLGEHMSRKATSLTYRKIINNMPDTLLQLKSHWTRDLISNEDDEWTEALASPSEVAIKSGFHLTQLKILH